MLYYVNEHTDRHRDSQAPSRRAQDLVTMPTYRIEYVMPRRKPRIVGADHFAQSSAFAPVLRLAVGESSPRGRYVSAGYKRITRVS